MEIKVTRKYVRGSALKMRELTRLIQGKEYDEAYNITSFVNKKASYYFNKLLRSAKANAEHNVNFTGRLFVKKAVADEGPTMKRFKTKARGSAGPIKRRTSHLTIILSDQL